MNKVGAYVQDGGGILATAGTKPTHSWLCGKATGKKIFFRKLDAILTTWAKFGPNFCVRRPAGFRPR